MYLKIDLSCETMGGLKWPSIVEDPGDSRTNPRANSPNLNPPEWSFALIPCPVARWITIISYSILIRCSVGAKLVENGQEKMFTCGDCLQWRQGNITVAHGNHVSLRDIRTRKGCGQSEAFTSYRALDCRWNPYIVVNDYAVHSNISYLTFRS